MPTIEQKYAVAKAMLNLHVERLIENRPFKEVGDIAMQDYASIINDHPELKAAMASLAHEMQEEFC